MIRAAAKVAAKDSPAGADIMADMFADTARHTLPNHLAAERGGALAGVTGAVEMTVAGSTPEQLFGEATAHWADLAFMDDPRQPA